MERENLTQEAFSEHRTLASNSFYSFLAIYGNFFFNLVIMFTIGRLVGPNAWGILIIANSYILIITLILSFFPPGLQQTFQYYLPRYNSLNQTDDLKSLIKTAFVTKLLFLIPIFLISLLVFMFFQQIFLINLEKNYLFLLFSLSPLIIINDLDLFLTSLNQGLNKYKAIFMFLILKNLLYISFLFSYFFMTGDLNLAQIAFFNVISYVISFAGNMVYVLHYLVKIKPSKKNPIFHNQHFKSILKYGSPIRAGRFLSDIWAELQIQASGTFFPLYTTGFFLSRTYPSVSTNALNSFAAPLTVSFSSLIAKDEKSKVKSIYNLIIKYSSFIFLTFTGMLFLATDFFLYILGTDYLMYSDMLKLYLFSYLFLGFAVPFDALMLAENKPKYVFYGRLIGFILRVPLFYVLIIFFGIYPTLFGIIISNVIFGMIYLLFTIKLGGITINLKPLTYLYLSFAISLVIITIAKFLFLDNVDKILLNFLHLGFLYYFYPLSIILFVFLFVVLTFVVRILTIEDIENLRIISQKQKFFNKILKSVIRILRKSSR